MRRRRRPRPRRHRGGGAERVGSRRPPAAARDRGDRLPGGRPGARAGARARPRPGEPMPPRILRARVAHTPRDPFVESGALETFDDGAVAFEDGTILATGAYAEVAR